MTTLTVVPESGAVEDVLATRYRAAYNKEQTTREQWIEAKLAFAVVMMEVREKYPADQKYSLWLQRHNLPDVGSDDRKSLVNIGKLYRKDPAAARTLFEQSSSKSIQHIWRGRPQQLRSRQATRPTPAHPPSPRRVRPERPVRAPGRRRYGQIVIPDVMREDNEGVEWKRAAAQPLPPPREFGPIKALLPEQVDPDFKGTPLEFKAKYGHVTLHTKEQIAHNEQQELLSVGHSAIAEHERTGRVMLAALAKVDPETLAAWLRKPGKREKLQGWINSIQRACDALRTLKSS